jgi:subtilisin family serine protease
MSRRTHLFLCLAAIAWVLGSLGSASATVEGRDPYIVVFKDGVGAPAALAHSQAEQLGGKLGFVYRYVLEGYSAELPPAAVAALERNPLVDYVSPDAPVWIVENEVGFETEDNEGLELLEGTVPTGISRTFATSNKALDIDGEDDTRPNVDVAVIDTGIDQSQKDLNVVGRTDCTVKAETCVENSGTDENSHGTHVAGTIGALDNGFGVVGMASGARLWSVKVLDAGGHGTFSQLIAGVEWVTAHASEIEVANMSIGGNSTSSAVIGAITKSIEKGVVYAVAAGNGNTEVSTSPANTKPAITVSAIADYDGKAGGKSTYTCKNYGPDDQRASFSNYGSLVDITAPGTCILSTRPEGNYGLKSGTSMAAPHVAGAAALLAAKSNPNSLKDVEAITATLRETGNLNWIDTSGDGITEPLLDVSNESVYALISAPVAVTGAVTYAGMGAATETLLTGTVNPKGDATTYQFEYVETAKYKPEAPNPYAEGSVAPLSPTSLGGTVDKDYEVKAALTGLKASTTYHYRIVAENSKGVSRGSDQSFTSLPACKGSEGKCEWSLQSVPNPELSSRSRLEDVSCPSSTMCMAVGNDLSAGKGVIEVWNGSKWTIVSSSAAELQAVFCFTANSCIALTKNEAKRLALFTFGGAWFTEVKSLPTPEGATEVRVKDVSCTAESACTVVGRYYAGSYKPYVTRWNGSTWSLQSGPNPSEGNASEAMLSVSCASSSFCMATGKAGSKPYVARWNGSEWSLLSAPNPAGGSGGALASVSCPTTAACVAVGSYSSSTTKALTEHWDGSSWSVVSNPSPGKEGYGWLRGVSCRSATSCMAVGSFLAPSFFFPTEEALVAESWNGSSWTLESAPAVEGKPFASFNAISCTSPVACTAVGAARPKYSEENGMVNLAERWG